MASSHYDSLDPIQQYNQLAYSIPPHPQAQQAQQAQRHPHPHPHPHSHSQPHLHPPHQTLPTNTLPSTPYHQVNVPALPSTTNNGVTRQRLVNSNPNTNTNNQTNLNPNLDAAPPSSSVITTDNNRPLEPPTKRRRVGRPPKSQSARNYEAYQAQRLASGIPPPPPPPPPVHTPHPLNKGPYLTAEDAAFSLQLHVFTSGYGVSQKRTVREKLPSGKYDPEGPVIRKDFACDRGGADFVSQSTGERRRESKKCGCPWRAVARRLKREGDLWFIDILHPTHNHPVTPPDKMNTIASYRRWQRDNNAGIRSAIDRLTRVAAMPARHIAAFLKGDFGDPVLEKVDRHILRALSMSDVELPGAAEVEARTSVAFDVIARRPTIVLLEGVGGGNTANGNGNDNDNGNGNGNGSGGLGDAGDSGAPNTDGSVGVY
ncbi:hypothetical protein GGR54DRAFT_623855 [Hypoxylon sp. NC1633]|nr:hypothetical protein GGR54DRAFT_623855 [Hypoxylon sp. NC1633]